MEFRTDREDCKVEAEAVVDKLSDLNHRLRQGTPPENLAYANSAYCGRYLFQGTCPAFWKWIDKCAFADSRTRGYFGSSKHR